MTTENKTENKKENIIVKYMLILAVYTAVAGAVLGITYTITEPKRVANVQSTEDKARQEVLSSAARFEMTTSENITYYTGYTQNEELAGYVIKAEGKGYSSTLTILIGLDKDLKITGVKVIAQAETPGLGTQVAETPFLKQFIGQNTTANFAVKKDGGNIDAVTGATISSRAATKAIDLEIKKLRKILRK